jgi:hypothetical protein
MIAIHRRLKHIQRIDSEIGCARTRGNEHAIRSSQARSACINDEKRDRSHRHGATTQAKSRRADRMVTA